MHCPLLDLLQGQSQQQTHPDELIPRTELIQTLRQLEEFMTKVLCAALIGAVVAGSAHAVGVNLIVNGGFETGTFAGWTATNNGITELTPWTVSGPGAGWFSNSSPLAGQFDALNGFDGNAGLVYELYQDVSIPSNHSALLTSHHRIVYDSLGIPSTLPRMFEISIRNTSNTVLSGLYSQSVVMNGSTTTDLGWATKSFDVSSFSGSTVRVHFREFIPENFTGPANIELDEISLVAAPLPEPAAIGLILCGGLLMLNRSRAGCLRTRNTGDAVR
jgi:hypothetical protein